MASNRSDSPARDVEQDAASERTPLLQRGSDGPELADQSQPHRQNSALGILRSIHSNSSGKSTLKTKASRRWPSLIALLLLFLACLLIIVFAFLAPSIVEEYAQQAAHFEPTSLGIDSFTDKGVKARVQGEFYMDASRVHKKSIRDLGRFGTWIAHKAESGASEVEVMLPEYGNVLLGTAHVPGIKVDVRNGQKNYVNFTTDLEPGNIDGIRRIASDWIDGRLGQLRVLGKATVPLKSGIFSIGKQTVSHELLFANKDIPDIPAYKIKKLNVHDAELPTGRGMAAEVSLAVQNDYPVNFNVPPLEFTILVDNCLKSDPPIVVASAITHELNIYPKQDVEVNVTGIVRQLPDTLTQACPGSSSSPLDALLGNYIHGKTNTIYVRGSNSPSIDTPEWISDLLSSVTVPVPLPGKTFGHLIRNFSLENTHFSLPSPFADEDDPEAQPRISADVKAIVALPGEMNFDLSVSRVRAAADVYYHKKKLGYLDLKRWQAANSTRIDDSPEGPEMAVASRVEDAPLYITDSDVFSDLIEAMLFGGKGVVLGIKADVDVEVKTALGELVVRKIPAEGVVPIKLAISSTPSDPPSGSPDHGDKGSNSSLTSGLRPKVYNLTIIETAKHSLAIAANVNITNPTRYSATIPFADVHILANGSLIAHATVRNMSLVPGNNTGLVASAVWSPLELGGKEGHEIGREFLSQYISGFNTTLTLRTHRGSVPNQPELGEVLSRFPIEIPTPRLAHSPPPSDDPDDGNDPKPNPDSPHFIEDAIMHLITSTATFTLMSPLRKSTLYVTSINATAFYREPGADEADPVGKILYDLPFAVPPIDEDGKGTQTPRLPVAWSLGSVGYDALRNALGGTLKMSAFAWVGIKLGQFEEILWFQGQGIGARVRL
ncbi:hypothetical protein K431DRAFT_285532 [Polychaeton citri CBS 116435]|uniref:Pre-rRNA processing protein n=1 Tax=Polychaeton citri CBS 116435 TaxID=1314669 RepID=A0A9P4Q6U2_9PEZI|nr:hypothetical protein K431DRAFT_285532 [Polychaeton citri CBS 116435]